jgi:coenzyme PQQ precursor peptide PqqA
VSITYLRFVVIGSERYIQSITRRVGEPVGLELSKEEMIMKTWMKPSVREQEVGLEVTSYLPAEIDLI